MKAYLCKLTQDFKSMESKSIKLEQGIQTAADSLKESLEILKNSQKKQMYILNFYKDI